MNREDSTRRQRADKLLGNMPIWDRHRVLDAMLAYGEEREAAVRLSEYQAANLRAAIEAIGYPWTKTWDADVGRSPLEVLNSGDWLGELYLKFDLYSASGRPNKTPKEYAAAANTRLADAHARGAREALEGLRRALVAHPLDQGAALHLLDQRLSALRRPAAEGDGDASASPSLERASSADLAGDVFERVAAEWHDIPYKQKILAALLRERFGPVVEALEAIIEHPNAGWNVASLPATAATIQSIAKHALAHLAGQPERAEGER